MLVLALALALAQPPSTAPARDEDARAPSVTHAIPDGPPPPVATPTRTYVSFRVGAAAASPRPQLCLEATPLEIVGIEACGSGGGFLHNAPGVDISHFLGKLRVTEVDVAGVQVEPWVAAGFAELQVGGDVPGFDFNGTSAGNVATAGPEVSASVRALWPLGAGFELVGELGVGLAYFSQAGALVVPQDPLQPQARANVGIGF